MHRAGEARILAITAPARIPELPDVPTLKEQGIDLEFANWRGFFAARGLPPERYAAMISTIEAVVRTPEFEAIRARNGWSRLLVTGRDFYRFLERQEQEIGSLMREIGYLR